MFLDHFMGNNMIKESLLGALASGRLSHGIILAGEKGSGVNQFAFLLAAEILAKTEKDKQSVFQQTHPRFQVIQGEGASGQIKVEKIRLLNQSVSFSAIEEGKRVILIKNCENFNLNSANALLKNLEEPKDDILYILTTNDISRILPTIRSRCGVYTLNLPEKQQVLQYFKMQKADMLLVEKLMQIYGCNIGKINSALTQPKRYEILRVALQAMQLIDQKERYALVKLCASFQKKKEDFTLFLQDLQAVAQNNLCQDNIDLLEVIQRFQEILKTNANLNLVLENFALGAIK